MIEGKILMSGMFLMLIIAGISGTISSAIGMKEDFKDREWVGGFGLLACMILLLTISALVICAWICYLASG